MQFRIAGALLIVCLTQISVEAGCSSETYTLLFAQGSRDLLVGATYGGARCQDCIHGGSAQNCTSACVVPVVYTPSTSSVTMSGEGVSYSHDFESRPQATYTVDACGNRFPPDADRYSDTEYLVASDLRSITAYGPVEVTFSQERCQSDNIYEQQCTGNARASVTAAPMATSLDACAIGPASPTVSALRMGLTSVRVVVNYAFPPTAAHRQIVVLAPGDTTDQVIGEVRDPLLSGTGPFIINVNAPAGEANYKLLVRVLYVDLVNDCMREDYGFAAVAPQASGISLVDGNMSIETVDPLPPIMDESFVRRYDSTNNVEGFFGRGWTSPFDQKVLFDFARTLSGEIIDYHLNVQLADNSYSIFREEYDATLDEFSYRQIWPEGQLSRPHVNWDFDAFEVTYRSAGSRIERSFDDTFGTYLGMRDVATGREALSVPRTDNLGWIVTDSHSGITWTVTLTDDLITEIASNGGLTWTYHYNTDRTLSRVAGPGNLTWRTYEYTDGLLSGVRDAAGKLIEERTYDSDGRVKSSKSALEDIGDIQYGLAGPAPESVASRVTLSTGGTTDVTFAPAAGFRAASYDGLCRTCGPTNLVSTFDESGRPLRQQTADGYITRYTYTAEHLTKRESGLRPSSCDPAASSTLCKLTPENLATVSLTETSASLTIDYEYDDSNWPYKPTATQTQSVLADNEEVREEFTYDAATGHTLTHAVIGYTDDAIEPVTLTTTTVLYDGTESRAFDPELSGTGGVQPPLPKTIDGPRTDVDDITTFVYYPFDGSAPEGARGKVAAVRNALGHVTKFENYDLFGTSRKVTDPNGVVTETTTDNIGRVVTHKIKAVDPCDTATDPLCATDLVTTLTYDGYGPVTTEERPDGSVGTFTYDGRGRLLTSNRGNGENDLKERVSTEYDPGTGRMSGQKYEEKVSGGTASWVERRRDDYSYTTAGQLERVTHPDNTYVEYAYDPAGRIATVQDENHATPNTTYTYGPAGPLREVAQTLATASGGSISTTYEYDAHGNLVGVTDPNGNETNYVFDDFGRMLRQESAVTGVTTYSYNPAGQLIGTTDANGATTTRTYDAVGRVLSASSARQSETETVSWDYDDGTFGIGRPGSMTDPTGSTAYTYDRRGMLLRELRTVDGNQYATTFRYDEAGNRSRLVNPSGRITDYTFDYAGRPSSAVSGATEIVTSASYLPFGPLKEIVLGNGTTRTIAFDNRYRPTTNVLGGPNGPIASYTYGYDAVGNITALHDAMNAGYHRDYTYDDLNRLIGADSGASLWGSGAMQYDAMGNMTASSVAKPRSFLRNDVTPKLSEVVEDGVSRGVTYDPAGNELTIGPIINAYSPRNLLAASGAVAYGYDGRGVRATAVAVNTITALMLDVESTVGGYEVTGYVVLGSPAPAAGMTVRVASNSSHASVPSTLEVPAGESSATFTVVTTAVASSEEVGITASLGLGSQLTTFTLNPPSLEELWVDSVIGGGVEGSGAVQLNGPAPAGGVVIAISSSETSVTVPATMTIPAGESFGSFTIATEEVVSPLDVMITVTYGASELEAELQVLPPGVQEIWFEEYQLGTGASTSATVALYAPAPAGGAVVTLVADAPALLTVPASVTVLEGETEATVAVTAVGPVGQITEVLVTATYNGYEAEDSLSILPPAVTGLSLTPSTIEGGQDVTAEVTLSEPAAQGTQITFSTTNSDAIAPAPLTITQGATTGQTTIDTKVVASMETAVLTAELQPTSASASLTIEPLALTLESVSVSPSTVVGSNEATLTVTLTEAAPAGGVDVELRRSGSLVTHVPYVTVPEGQTSVTVGVTTAVVAGPETVNLRATHAVTTRGAYLTITPAEGNHVASFTLAAPSAVGGDPVTGTITLADVAGSGGVTISLTSSNTAAATVPSSVTVSEGNTTASFDIDTEAVTQSVDVNIRTSYNDIHRSARLTIVPSAQTVALESVSIDSGVVGDFDATGMVTLSAAAPSGGIVVALGGSRAGLATVPASITIAQGQTTATFTITTVRPLATSEVLVTAQYDGLVRTALLTIFSNWELRRPPGLAIEGLRTGRGRSGRRGIGRNSVSLSAPTSTPARQRNITVQTEDPERRYYFYTPELNLLAETQLTTSATPAVEWEYVWFGGQAVAQIETATDAIAWYFNDHLGTPVLETDASANVIWRIEREPYGKVFNVRTGADRHQPLAFPGQEEDGGDTAYNIFRWYRAGWGRYTQADPIGLSGALRHSGTAARNGDVSTAQVTNLYAYVVGNPTNVIDPSGLFPLTQCQQARLEKFFPTLNLDDVELVTDSDVLPPDGFAAITLDQTIYFADGAYDTYDTAKSLELLAHELTHVEQYDTLGTGVFLAKYGWQSLKSLGYPATDQFEEAARENGRVIRRLIEKEGAFQLDSGICQLFQ